MEPIKDIEKVRGKILFSDQDILNLFNGKISDSVRTTVKKFIDEEIACDFPVITANNWKIVLNIKPTVEPTRPEAHRDWHDASIYITGSNNISVGTSLAEAVEKEPGNGEWRGGTIQEKNVIPLTVGDLLFVPAGIPHQNKLSPSTAFFVMKIKKTAEHDSPLSHTIKTWEDIVHTKNFCEI